MRALARRRELEAPTAQSWRHGEGGGMPKCPPELRGERDRIPRMTQFPVREGAPIPLDRQGAQRRLDRRQFGWITVRAASSNGPPAPAPAGVEDVDCLLPSPLPAWWVRGSRLNPRHGTGLAWPKPRRSRANTTTSSSAPARPAACWPTGCRPIREAACCCSRPAARTTGSGFTSRSAICSPSAIRAPTGCSRPSRRRASTAAASTIRAAR